MESLLNCLLCLLFTLVLFQAFKFITRRSRLEQVKLPPGPVPLPLIGNILELGDQPHKSLARLSRTHGPLMSLRLGQVTTIVISSASLAKEVMQSHDLTFANRTIVDAIRAQDHHEAGMPWLPVGKLWKNLRKVSYLHIFASQKLDANEELRRRKVQELLDVVEESSRVAGVIDIGEAAFRATLNAVSNTFFSLDLADTSSHNASELKEVMRVIMEEVGKPNLADYFPVLQRIDPRGIRHRTEIHFGKVLDLFDLIIDERTELRGSQGYVTANDMLDTLLDINEEQGSEKLDRNQIKHFFLDLFVAGSDTTSTTLEWAMAELIKNPKAFARAQEELRSTIEKGSMVNESDFAKLPFLQAVIKETFRLHPAVPLLLPRKAGADVELCGYMVPKNSQVLVNAWAIGRDPTVWEDPDSFLPERFLGSDIDVGGHHFELIPFGAGRRICPGLPLAMRMLRLMLGSLIHLFDWKLEEGVTIENLDMEDKFGISMQKAKPLRAIAIPI